MGKKSEKLEAAKAKNKSVKAGKTPKPDAKTAVKIVPKTEAKPVPKASSGKKIAKAAEKAAPAPKTKEVAKTKGKAPAKSSPPTFDEIQREAYHIAQKRIAAGIDGTAASDWIEAEKALLAAHDL